MKKLFFAICAAVAVFSFSACQKSDSISLTIEKQWTASIESEYVVLDLSKSGTGTMASSSDGVNFYIAETYTVKNIKYNDDKKSGTITLSYGEGTKDAEEGEVAFKDLTESTASIQIKGDFLSFKVSNHTLKSAPADK